jgi:hypothetical protein
MVNATGELLLSGLLESAYMVNATGELLPFGLLESAYLRYQQ